MNRIKRLAGAGLVMAALVVAAPIIPSAMAQGGGVKTTGPCSVSAKWSLKLSPEDGGKLQTQFEVDDAKAGSTWSIKITDNGTRIFSGSRTANSLGEAKVSVTSPDQAGQDAVKATATNTATGEVCSGSATL